MQNPMLNDLALGNFCFKLDSAKDIVSQVLIFEASLRNNLNWEC